MKNNLSFAFRILNNLNKFKKIDEIDDKNVKRVYKKCKKWEDIYLYILDLLKDETSSKANSLKVYLYSLIDKAKYRNDYILAIHEYLKNLDEEEIEAVRRYHKEYHNPLTTYNLAKNILRANLLEKLAYLEFKNKNYNDALSYIDEAIELQDMTRSIIKLKIDILLKLNRKNEIIDFLNSIKKSIDYQNVKDMSLEEASKLEGRYRKEILRQFLVKFEVDMALEKIC